MMLQNNPFGGLPSFGGMAGSGGFAGGMPGFGQGMFGSPMDDDEEKKRKGMFGPMSMGLGLIPSMFMSGHPNLGLGMISPALGISRALGLFK